MFRFKSLFRFLAVGLGIIAILSISSASVFAAEKPEISEQDSDVQKNNWLLGVIFKLENMRDKAIADIQKYEGEIQKCENTISKSDNIVRLAQQKGNVKAEMIAREASLKAQEAKIKNKEKKNSAEFNKIRAEGTLATVKNELSNALSHPQAHPDEIKSVITNHSGRVEIQKENGEIIGFGKNQIGLLERGDFIMTYGNSSAELQFLEGRGSLKVGEYSKIKMEADDAGTEVMNMIQGKVNISVEKVENYQKMMEEKIKAYKEDLKTVKDATKQEKLNAYENYLKGLKSRMQNMRKKFEIQTPATVSSPRGTEFLVFEDDKTGTEIIVLEGSVEMKVIKGGKTIIVNAGYKGAVTKDGKLSEPEKIDLSKIERWWER